MLRQHQAETQASHMALAQAVNEAANSGNWRHSYKAVPDSELERRVTLVGPVHMEATNAALQEATLFAALPL
jgi:hypothetical protein